MLVRNSEQSTWMALYFERHCFKGREKMRYTCIVIQPCLDMIGKMMPMNITWQIRSFCMLQFVNVVISSVWVNSAPVKELLKKLQVCLVMGVWLVLFFQSLSVVLKSLSCIYNEILEGSVWQVINFCFFTPCSVVLALKPACCCMSCILWQQTG